MENASKALIMAGGMLIVVLLVSLVLYAWKLFAEYQTSQDNLSNIENVTEFNLKFTNYDRDNVQGYEIISLINQVIDYNSRKSNVSDKNDEGYNPITLIIEMGSMDNRKKLTRDDNIRLFSGPGNLNYTQSGVVNQLNTILNEVNQIETIYGGADRASKIAKIIGKIYDTTNTNEAIEKFNAISEFKVNNSNELNSEKNRVYSYYEYVQFKKAVFKCTKLTYDDVSGRVNEMKFEFTGKIH